MRIWVDADACPAVIKEILFRAADRAKVYIILVANQALRQIPSLFVKNVQVPPGFDVADNHIVKNLETGDLVITADVPLADAVVTKGGMALNPRGELYSERNIKQRLSIRNFSADLRSSGKMTSGPSTLSKKDIQSFANNLDQILTKYSLKK